jgi:O-antigen/teichoic acid export membrane protein
LRKDLTSIAAVFSGTAGAQLIGLACAPLLTRLFLPEAFGHVGVFLALAGVLMPIAALTLARSASVKQTFNSYCTINFDDFLFIHNSEF